METDALQRLLLEWLSQHGLQLAVTVLVLVSYWLLDRFSAPKLTEGADQGRFKTGAGTKAVRVARVITGLFGLLLLIGVWGIDLSALLIIASTTITLLGVALFASWSLLSNVTAYFILLLQPSFRRGNFIRIIDVDNYVEGYIADLTVFHTKLVTESREVVVYPNNLLLSRPTMINPRERLEGIGKLGKTAESKQA